jgi:signal transduction histidine kinase/CheY-like chemotaxis protein
VTLAVAGTRLAETAAGVRFFDNAHWTLGYATGALLAWTGWRRRPSPARLCFLFGTGSYLAGQLLWDLQVASGWNPFPGPSDLFFIALGPWLAVGFAFELARSRPATLWAAGLDLFGMSAAALACTLSLYLPKSGESTLLVTATLAAYPVVLSMALGTGLVALLARRWRPRGPLLLLLGAIFVKVAIWGDWNLRTLEGRLGDGILLNYVFSYTAIALGVGIALFDPREIESAHDERVYYVLSSMLPILLAVGAGVALSQSPLLPAQVSPWVRGCSLVIVVSAVARQGLVLVEREERLAAERKARILADQYSEAVERHERAQRLEALGTLAAGVAHDFNNLLMGIRSHADLATRFPAHSASSWEAVMRACERGAAVVQGMLAFGRQRAAVEPRRLELSEAVSESLRLLRALIPKNVVFETRFDPRTPRILADPAQLQQILMNLAVNAAHAIGSQPGRIEIATRGRAISRASSRALAAGDYAEIVVSDSGSGMDPLTQLRIFEPFFSTKDASEGAGMGLAVVHGIVTAARGAIECETAPGMGSSFTILWPAATGSDAQEAREKPGPAEELVPTGAEVLVVDDEKAVAAAVEQYLDAIGFRAHACNDPREALELVRREPGRFAAVVCDLTMPELRGDALCRELVALRPDLPVILSTGTEPERLAESGFAAVLVKPYSLDELARLIERVLPKALTSRDRS